MRAETKQLSWGEVREERSRWMEDQRRRKESGRDCQKVVLSCIYCGGKTGTKRRNTFVDLGRWRFGLWAWFCFPAFVFSTLGIPWALSCLCVCLYRCVISVVFVVVCGCLVCSFYVYAFERAYLCYNYLFASVVCSTFEGLRLICYTVLRPFPPPFLPLFPFPCRTPHMQQSLFIHMLSSWVRRKECDFFGNSLLRTCVCILKSGACQQCRKTKAPVRRKEVRKKNWMEYHLCKRFCLPQPITSPPLKTPYAKCLYSSISFSHSNSPAHHPSLPTNSLFSTFPFQTI